MCLWRWCNIKQFICSTHLFTTVLIYNMKVNIFIACNCQSQSTAAAAVVAVVVMHTIRKMKRDERITESEAITYHYSAWLIEATTPVMATLVDCIIILSTILPPSFQTHTHIQQLQHASVYQQIHKTYKYRHFHVVTYNLPFHNYLYYIFYPAHCTHHPPTHSESSLIKLLSFHFSLYLSVLLSAPF